ncbi:TolC family protein [Fusobacterium sp. 1001295B_180824_G3]|uniref:TolC family protein n=1 Tax=Fusobacterium sp. 1001295B_180824_G3 TaxID=2787123 RepID=UPI00189C50BD|nr:TolC family protein [Fusobacterium sp. 1001295B_180824_G3]
MKLKNNLIFLSFILFFSCSNITKVDIEEENKNMLKELKEKEASTENLRKEKEGVLYLDECIDLALKNNSQIKLKEIETKIAKIEKNISFGNFLPRISAMYSISELDRYVSATIPAPDITLGILGGITLPSLPVTLTSRMVDKDFKNYALTAQLPIFVPATWFLYSARAKGENIGLYTEDLTKKMIKLKVISEYYYILALITEKSVLESEYAYAKKLNKNAKLALETESILKWQEEQTKLLVKQKENAIENNKRDLQIAKMNLMNDLGLDLNSDFRFVFPEDTVYKLPPLEDVVYDALINSELIKISHNVVGISKDKIKIAMSSFLPQISLSGGVVGTGLTFLNPKNILFGAVAGFLSLFNGFKDVNEYEKAKLQSEAAYIQREEVIMNTIISAVDSYNNVKKSIEDKELADMNYKIANEKFKQKKLENEVGNITDADLLNEMAELENATSLKEKADFKYSVSVAALKMLIEKGE